MNGTAHHTVMRGMPFILFGDEEMGRTVFDQGVARYE
jgi:hypothetical protein